MGNLESLYAEGRGAPSGGGPRAVDWYKPGADAGVRAAQYRLGMIYLKGDGVPRDDQLAAKYLKGAAEQGHAGARKEAGELLYSMGRDEEASALGHEAATKRWAKKRSQGNPQAEAYLLALAERNKRQLELPPPVFPRGISRDPGPDHTRALAVRVGGVAVAHGAAGDAAIANVYDIIRWFPETDGKKK
jgi:TPR repeat protein